MEDHRQIQKTQFEKSSVNYKRINSRVYSAVSKDLREHYYPRCAGKKILDVGNGGQSPAEIFGEQIATDIINFVGLDYSIAMLKREETNYIQVVGDGLHLPFKDKMFDYVICNGIIHHLGFASLEDQTLKVKQLINEFMRVCIHQVIMYEIFTSTWLERAERFVAGILGYMPTFVLSEFTLDKYLNQIGLSRREIISKTLSDLTNPFHWYIVIMDYEFFKLPAFLSPFRHVLFVLSKSGSLSKG